MIAGDAECQASGERREVGWRIPVGMQLLWSCECRLQQGLVADTGIATVLGYLPLVDGESEGAIDPDDHATLLFGQPAKQVAVFPHDLFGHFHLRGEDR